METEVKLSGRAAAMGRGVIQDVSGRIVDTFSANLAQMLSGPQAEQPAAAAEAPEPAPAAEPASESQSNGAAQAEEQAATATATAEAPRAQPSPPPGPAPGSDGARAEEALPIGSFVGSVAAQRLRDPKVLAVLAFILVLILRRRR
jgi:hypothetical protein